MAEQKGGRLDRASAGLYRLLSHSWLGRFLRGYRRTPTALLPGEGRVRPGYMPSARRTRWVQAVEQSRLLAFFGSIAHVLTDIPARAYGVFFLEYGCVAGLICLIQSLLQTGHVLDWSRLLLSVLPALVAIPLVSTERSLVGAVGSGRRGRAILSKWLGVPEERIERPPIAFTVELFVLCGVLGVGAGLVSLWIGPLLIPISCVVIGVVGLVLTCPEAGVSLSAVMLPVIWIWEETLHALVGLILLTWLGYGVKLLRMHRSFRMGRLDSLLALLGILLICGGLFSVEFSMKGLWQGALLAVLLSYYFLIVNLTDSRSAVKRCMGGVLAGIFGMILLSCVRLISASGLGWLEEYRLGKLLGDGVRYVTNTLDALWSASFEQFLVLTLPFLLVLLFSCKRPLSAVLGAGATGLCIFLIWQTHSPLGVVAVLLTILLFALLYGHRSLTVMAATLPLALTGCFWYTYSHPLSELWGQVENALRESIGKHIRLWPGVYKLIKAYPAGLGLGERAFRAVYPRYAEPGMATATGASNLYLDLLATLGLPGLAVALVTLVLYWQKSFTCLRYCRKRWDRMVLIAGLCTVTNFMLLGVFRSVGTSPQLFYCLILVMGLCSALASICFAEQEVLTADRRGDTPEQEDRFLWANT